MRGDYTRKYYKIYEDKKAQFANDLKNRIKKATYQTHQEIIDHFSAHVNKLLLQLFSDEPTSRSSRGGASVDYDAAMVINLTRDKESGPRVATMRKSRYGTQG